MAIRVYSDKTQKFYNTVEEANRAEFELKEKENLEKIKKEREVALAKEQKEKEMAERKAAAEKVETARKAYLTAQKAYHDELSAFINKYKTYHYSTSNPDEVPSLFDIFKHVFPW